MILTKISMVWWFGSQKEASEEGGFHLRTIGPVLLTLSSDELLNNLNEVFSEDRSVQHPQTERGAACRRSIHAQLKHRPCLFTDLENKEKRVRGLSGARNL